MFLQWSVCITVRSVRGLHECPAFSIAMNENGVCPVLVQRRKSVRSPNSAEQMHGICRRLDRVIQGSKQTPTICTRPTSVQQPPKIAGSGAYHASLLSNVSCIKPLQTPFVEGATTSIHISTHRAPILLSLPDSLALILHHPILNLSSCLALNGRPLPGKASLWLRYARRCERPPTSGQPSL